MYKHLLLSLSVFCLFSATAQKRENAAAFELIKKNKTALGLSDDDIKNSLISDSYFNNTSGTHLVYLQQTHLDIPVLNELMVLAFKDERLVSNTGSRISSVRKKVNSPSGVFKYDAADAVMTAISDRNLSIEKKPLAVRSEKNGQKLYFGNLGIAREDITAELLWVPVEEKKKLILAWQIYFVPSSGSDYWIVNVNASDNSVISVNNLNISCSLENAQPEQKNHAQEYSVFSTEKTEQPFTNLLGDDNVLSAEKPTIINDASYEVIKFPAESPSHPGGAPAIVFNPWDAAAGNATTLKWHTVGNNDYNYTRGNNVWSRQDVAGNNGAGSSATSTTTTSPLTFEFNPDFTQEPTSIRPKPNQQFSITNLFYWTNILHDLTYQYGFDEVSGNFQASNMGRGGLGNDFVFADAQDGSGTNNANFATPPDGSSPRMQMYLWNGTPKIDGSLDNGIVSHEYAHGITTRLTGGPSQSGCLFNDEQMGEGWSDYFGLMLTQDWAKSNLNSGFSTPRAIGTYALGQQPNGQGLRSKRYCTNFAVNDKVYGKTIDTQTHNRGEIWCATLWDMTWNIINEVGSINPNLYDADGGGGNTIALKLVMEGLKLQPCSPGFIDGRDAILKADQLLYNGAHSCAIKEAFRRRGMGSFASQGSSTSVKDQIPDFSTGDATLTLTQNVTEVPEGQKIIYTNTVTTGSCSGISNFLITDTLPSNVTYVEGGTYNPTNRVVSFPVNMGASEKKEFVFTVQVNNGAYYPTVTIFEDTVSQTSLSDKWIAASSTSSVWSVSQKRSFSPASSLYSSDPVVESSQTIRLKNAISLGSTPPPLTFRHWFNTEAAYDGGLIEVSTDGGTAWKDLLPSIISGGYNITMDAASAIPGARAWSGSSNNKFIKTKINLSTFANKNILFRFRFSSDNGTNLEGWYIDDISIKDMAVVEMQSNLYNASKVNVTSSDTVTKILPFATCIPVSISKQPVDISACVNSTASLNIIAGGTSPAYQWQISNDNGINFSDIPGANQESLNLSNVAPNQNNSRYRVIVSNNCPSSVTSAEAILSVSDPADITGQPIDAVLCAGGNTQFSITAAGTVKNYQWQISTDGGNTFIDLSGENTSTLQLNNIVPAMNGNQYRIKVFSCGPDVAISSAAKLTVNSVAEILTQPTGITACIGTSAVFESVFSGTTLSYKWQVSNDQGLNFSDLPGETSATLKLSDISASMDKLLYRVIATSVACPGSDTSDAVMLMVSNNTDISSQPSGSSACVSSSTVFSVDASGAGLTYQWQLSKDGGATFTDISGETNATLNLNDIKLSMDNSLYRVSIKSACSATPTLSDAVILDVLPLVEFTQQPASQSACINTSATFTATASGNALTYQWQESKDDGVTFNDIQGATGNSLTLSSLTAAMNKNRYRLSCTGVPCGNVISSVVTLNISAPAEITTQPADLTVCENKEAKFSVSATGSSLSYQWQRSTDNGNNYSDIANAKNNELILSNTTASVNGTIYRAVITESVCGSINSTAAKLNVNPLPVISIKASPAVTLLPGKTVTLSASSTPASNAYSWFLNGTLLSGPNANSANLEVSQSGAYKASVEDANGCVGSSNVINVRDSVLSETLIYPNPSNGRFQVRHQAFSPDNKTRTVVIYDSKGAKVYAKNFSVSYSYEPMEIIAEKLTQGVYLLMLLDANGKNLKSAKFLIVR